VKKDMTKRGSGILLHLTSLPGEYGIGDLGAGAFRFIDFLYAAGQSYWQFLPIGPTSLVFDNSPYMSRSVFAGNPLCISPEKLHAKGLLSQNDLADRPDFSEYVVDYEKITLFKNKLLQIAFHNYNHSGPDNDFKIFCQDHKNWLDDYALFMCLRDKHHLKPWHEWPTSFARRNSKSLSQFSRKFEDKLLYYKFIQYIFFTQWQNISEYAKSKGISLIGDIPIYVGFDSVDVWANQELFKLDTKTCQPTKVAGVPPDYFSETGQRWGNPVYKWYLSNKKINEQLLNWWLARFKHIFSMMDMVRIDHFRGFESYWEIPARDKTAVNGSWIKGPGKTLFQYISKKLGPLPIIAEDLGVITPAVTKMRKSLGYPGMKVLQFAFESDETNPYLPHNYTQTNMLVYTGTHDNNTTLGWFLGDKLPETARNHVRQYINSTNDEHISWDLIRLAMSTIADLAIIPLQDILGFGEDCRMNTPGTADNNWRWRCGADFLNDGTAQRLHDITSFYNRSP
jgi:4-alpha-glucanotransferase